MKKYNNKYHTFKKPLLHNKKAFTLIELLAVIIILGILMIIAIPSVTNYISQSRKKSLAITIENYITAFSHDVNNLKYNFIENNTIYAVPIDCIALEHGGTDPFGEWHQANKTYFAYVLVQYNSQTASYIYGYTFKDSVGIGLYPTTSQLLEKDGNQIQSNLDLIKPSSGIVTNLTAIENWQGFNINENTKLVVLDAESEGEKGDGEQTCTLLQKGDNYKEVEEEKEKRLGNLIKRNNVTIIEQPTLTTAFKNTKDKSGLYKSTNTNSGKETLYFRGNVTNNNVKFANLNWKILRINEDGTIRIILNDKINNNNYVYNSLSDNYTYMYYSNSEAKNIVDKWYNDNLLEFDQYISTENFCEQAKVHYTDKWLSGNATMELSSKYKPNFKCETDGNNKGILNSKVGLITYDEAIHAGGYYGVTSNNYFLYTEDYDIWTMSPNGKNSTGAGSWFIKSTGAIYDSYVTKNRGLSPVINLKRNVIVTNGNGSIESPYEIETK